MTNPSPSSTPATVATAPSTPAITDLAAELIGQLNAGRAAARATIGSNGVAFAWAEGVGPTLAQYCLSSVVDGMSYTAVKISPTATPAAKVAAGGKKPTAVQIATAQQPLSKYAGLALVTVEDALSADGLIAALAQTILGQAYAAFDADLIAAVVAAGTAVDGNGAAGILAGIGQVFANGGHPTVALMSPATLADAFTGFGSGFTTDPSQPIGALFGLSVLLTPNVDDGQAVIVDPTGIMVAQNRISPAAVVDPYSLADTNTTRVVSEVIAGFTVASSQAIAVVTVTAPSP